MATTSAAPIHLKSSRLLILCFCCNEKSSFFFQNKYIPSFRQRHHCLTAAVYKSNCVTASLYLNRCRILRKRMLPRRIRQSAKFHSESFRPLSFSRKKKGIFPVCFSQSQLSHRPLSSPLTLQAPECDPPPVQRITRFPSSCWENGCVP